MRVDGRRSASVLTVVPWTRLMTAMAVATLWLSAFSSAAGAQASGTPAGRTPEGVVVVVDTSDVLPSGGAADKGVLRRTNSESAAPLLATYTGLSAVGATLALITAHRRGARRRERELLTGIAFVRRRRRQDFWLTEVSSARTPI